MSNRDLTLSAKLYADATRFIAGFTTAESGVRKFTSSAKREFNALKNMIGSVEGKLASLGVTVGATASIIQSANLDRELKLLKLSAGASADETVRLRKELFEAQKQYGSTVDDMKSGVDALIAGGLNMQQATATVDPMAQTLLVAKTNADALAKAMGVASRQFNIDLGDQKQAAALLDKMVVSGRAGNAELENLPDVFARVGANARKAKLDVDQTLALTETLSLFEPDSNRLGTLVDSTLRVFTNANYLKNAQKGTGIKFFDAEGNRRDPLTVLEEIEKKYKSLKTERDKFNFTSKAFGQADADTIKGLESLLAGDTLSNLGTILTDIRNSSGTVARDVADALSDAGRQVSRLKGALREAADAWSKPINKTIANIIQYTMDSKAKGGLGLDGKDMILGGAGAVIGTALTARYGGKAIGALAGKFGSVGTGVATGKALEQAAGVMPVYVVNMPAAGIGGLGVGDAAGIGAGTAAAAGVASKFKVGAALLGGSNMAALKMMGVGAMGTAGLGVAAAGAAGYGVGSLINKGIEGTALADAIGRTVAAFIAPFSADARTALMNEFKANKQELQGEVRIKVDSEGRATLLGVTSKQKGIDFDVLTGQYMGAMG